MNERQEPATSYDEAREDLERWEWWLDLLEGGVLDFYEYESMLHCRSGLEEALVLAGDESLFDELDALDARFDDLTIAVSDSPVRARLWSGPYPGPAPHRSVVGASAARR